MTYQIEELTDNVHRFKIPCDYTDLIPTLMISDVHYDSIKCKRELLKKHLDKIVAQDGLIFIYGDWFDIMATYGDKRMKREGVDSRYIVRGRSYLDVVIEDSIEFLSPYAENIALISAGNHECYHGDTEVLTEGGWKNIKDVTTDDLVATFNEDQIYWEYPNATVSKPVDSFYEIEGQVSAQKVSAKHNVVLNDMSKIHAEDIESLKDRDLPYGMKFDSDHWVDPYMVKVLTTVAMDATMVDRSKYGKTSAKRIQYKISKPEKIEYIRSVLDEAGIEYTFKEATKSPTNNLQPYYIRIYSTYAEKIFKWLNGEKHLPDWFRELTGENFNSFLEALENTDAHRANGNTLEWNGTCKRNVDIVQYMCTLNGYGFSYKINDDGSGFENGKRQYRCRIQESISNSRDVEIIKHEGGMSYCLNMPSGRFVTRYKGKVAFSGNTAIQKHCDTDPIFRLVTGLNRDNGTNIQMGAYSGYILMDFANKNGSRRSKKIHYHHGFGGNAKRSKGMLDVQIEVMKYPDADLLCRGHDHQKWYDPSTTRFRVDPRTGDISKDSVGYLKTGSYKDGLEEGKHGWEVEKNFLPTKMGGWYVNFSYHREKGVTITPVEAN